MDLVVKKSCLKGRIVVPGSKSHAVRALVLASLADGVSRIRAPLYCDDSAACLGGCRAFGAVIEEKGCWVVKGFNGRPGTPAKDVDLANSGISTNFLAGVAAHAKGPTVITGGDSLRSRPFAPICRGITDLGGKAEPADGAGRPPLKISGFLRGGCAEIDGLSSQPVSSLLVSCAVAARDSEINVVDPHETPYVEMTLRWMESLGLRCRASGDFARFSVSGGQSPKPFDRRIPGDWSSAAFPLCAAAVTPGSEVLVEGLDMDDSQGDREILGVLKRMGADIRVLKRGILVRHGPLSGIEVDLNCMPDALPALAVAGCFAEGETRLVNVPQARIKETDRIAAMGAGLRKMGAGIEERPDGLVVRKSSLKGAEVRGCNDHRTIMALAVAGLNATGVTRISTAEGVKKTYPSFVDSMRGIGAKMGLSQ